MASEEYKQLSLFDLEDVSIDGGFEKWSDGSIVKNICNNKDYVVRHDDGDIVEVFDKEKGYLIMAKSDLEMIKPKTEGIFFWDGKE